MKWPIELVSFRRWPGLGAVGQGRGLAGCRLVGKYQIHLITFAAANCLECVVDTGFALCLVETGDVRDATHSVPHPLKLATYCRAVRNAANQEVDVGAFCGVSTLGDVRSVSPL